MGGTAVALHGVRVPVNDLDLEMDARGTYCFQELFAAYATRPVSLSESDLYRSHFGRFELHGTTVEVMGDMQRREGEAWVPTMALTETVVELDEVPIHVSWLEEETLAYIRRGRLQRAALCLPHCDHDRLMRLLRGDLATNVLSLAAEAPSAYADGG